MWVEAPELLKVKGILTGKTVSKSSQLVNVFRTKGVFYHYMLTRIYGIVPLDRTQRLFLNQALPLTSHYRLPISR